MLSNALMTKPHEVSTAVSYLLGKESRPNLDFLLGGLNNKLVVTNRQYEWNVMLDTIKAVTINKAIYNGQEINQSNYKTLTPGLSNSTITLYLAAKWLAPGLSHA